MGYIDLENEARKAFARQLNVQGIVNNLNRGGKPGSINPYTERQVGNRLQKLAEQDPGARVIGWPGNEISIRLGDGTTKLVKPEISQKVAAQRFRTNIRIR